MLAAFSPTPWHRPENSNVSRTFSCGRRGPTSQLGALKGTDREDAGRQCHLRLVQILLLDVGGCALHNKLVLVVPVVCDVALHLQTQQQSRSEST